VLYIALVGTVKATRKLYFIVVVEKMLYQNAIVTDKKELKVYSSDASSPLSRSQKCCKRMAINSTYIFAGTYQAKNRNVKFTTNGCRTVYKLSVGKSAVVDVNNIEHSFLEQCRFRILASNSP